MHFSVVKTTKKTLKNIQKASLKKVNELKICQKRDTSNFSIINSKDAVTFVKIN